MNVVRADGSGGEGLAHLRCIHRPFGDAREVATDTALPIGGLKADFSAGDVGRDQAQVEVTAEVGVQTCSGFLDVVV